MDEAQRLQQQIDYWQNRIDTHLSQQEDGSFGYNSNWSPRRGSPYGVRRGSLTSRGSRASYRNRTLVTKYPAVTPTTPSYHANDSRVEPAAPTDRFVSTTGRHMQLINSSIYDRVTQQRTQDVEQTRVVRRQARADKEAARLKAYFAATKQSHETQTYEIEVQGVRFRITDEGSKLVKVSDHPLGLVPRRTTVGGVTFFRSKHGNLYRAGVLKRRRGKLQKSLDPCVTFSNTGSCPNGPGCRFIHDAEKVAICKDYLQKGTCPAGDFCDLSHDPTPHRVPACIHFLRGNCTKEECRYAHVKVNPGAPVCRAFATYGFCGVGSACSERHITECPDYANKGFCHKKNCRLPHVDRAGHLRKTAASAPAGSASSPDDSGSLGPSSDESDQSEDVDSDEDIFIHGIEGAGVDVADNRDFVSL